MVGHGRAGPLCKLRSPDPAGSRGSRGSPGARCAKRNAVTFALAIGMGRRDRFREKVLLRISAALDAFQTAVTPEVRCSWAADYCRRANKTHSHLS